MRLKTTQAEDLAILDPFMLDAEADAPKVFVVLCVYKPDESLLRNQLASVLAQTHGNIEVVVVPDGPSPEAEKITKEFRDSRIVYTPETGRVGVYANFIRALAHALSRSESPSDLYAYCDQDDIWRASKVSDHVAYLEGHSACTLTHSDARVVDADGNVIHDSMFAYEKRNSTSPLSRLLLINNVTGMTAVFRKSVATLATNAPPQKGLFFHHDLWTAMIAGSIGEIRLIKEPLVDYVQHGQNVIGAVEVTTGPKKRKRGFMTQAYIRMCVDQYVVRYYLFRRLKAALGHDRQLLSAAMSGLTRKLYGAGYFGIEALLYAVYLAIAGNHDHARQAFRLGIGKFALWVEAMSIKSQGSSVHRFRARANGECKAVLGYTASPETVVAADWLAYEDCRMRPIENLEFTASVRAVNLLVPTLNPDQIFAGIATALDFASLFIKHGYHVRFIATDMPIRDKNVSENFILGRVNVTERTQLAQKSSLVDFRNEHKRVVGRNDLWIATAWWTAHVAQVVIDDSRCNTDRFIYMIQDFEPGFYPWSGDYANAMASYKLDFTPVFNTTYLRDYFAQNRFIQGAETALCFSPSLHLENYTPDAKRLSAKKLKKRRLIFYGRPSVARNLFDLGVSALARWCLENEFTEADVELLSVGEQHDDIQFPNGLVLRSLGKLSWADYPAFLQTGDIGLSLMLSPHPSHIPLEMAASGIVCVTNRYDVKDMSMVSKNIISVDANINDVVVGLSSALVMSNNSTQRVKKSKFSVNLGDEMEDTVNKLVIKG